MTAYEFAQASIERFGSKVTILQRCERSTIIPNADATEVKKLPKKTLHSRLLASEPASGSVSEPSAEIVEVKGRSGEEVRLMVRTTIFRRRCRRTGASLRRFPVECRHVPGGCRQPRVAGPANTEHGQRDRGGLNLLESSLRRRALRRIGTGCRRPIRLRLFRRQVDLRRRRQAGMGNG